MLTTRFILDLHEVYQSREPSTNAIFSSIQFVGTVVAGNMAAPLDTASCWVTNASGDEDGAEKKGVETANPFSFGLLHSIVEEDIEVGTELAELIQ